MVRRRSVLAIPVTVELFSLLGVQPALGRTFGPDDLSGGCTIVLAHRFWQNSLGAARDIVGHSLALDERACTVAGVMPATFAFFPEAADMWRLIAAPADRPRGGIGVFGRLKPGINLERAQAELSDLHRQLHSTTPHGASLIPTVYGLAGEFTWMAGRNLRLTLLVLFVAVSFVLLIACLNVANLLLGRSLARQREFGVRAALGSGRWRLLRQVLTEGFLLSSLGAAVGVVFAVAAVRVFSVANPIELPPGSLVSVDAPVLGFAAALAIVTALLFAVVPALKASSVDVAALLRTAGRGASDHRGRRALGKALVVIEMTCSVVLVFGAGLLLSSVERFGSARLGFEPDGVLTMIVRLPRMEYDTSDRRARFHDELIAALKRQPDIREVALATTALRGRGTNLLSIEGQPPPTLETSVPDVALDTVSADYFRLLRVPIMQGRSFDDGDRHDAARVAVINEALARKYFPGGDAIGRRVKPGSDASSPWLTIVGVVGNQRVSTVYQEMAWVETPLLFTALQQTAPADTALLLRAGTDRRAEIDVSRAGAAVQQVVAGLNPNVPISDVQTMRSRIARDLKYPVFRARVLSAFAVLALLLAIVGLYAVLSQLVAQRSREIGIRVALGAPRSTVVRFVAAEGMQVAAAGLGVGLIAAFGLARFIEAMLYGIAPTDVTLTATVSLSLALAAFLATWLPARRAAGIDPAITLRAE